MYNNNIIYLKKDHTLHLLLEFIYLTNVLVMDSITYTLEII